MKSFLFYILSIVTFTIQPIYSQGLEVSYSIYNNEQLSNQDNPVLLRTTPLDFLILNKKQAMGQELNYPYEQFYFQTNQDSLYSLAYLSQDKSIKTINTQRYTSYKLEKDTKEILGYLCHKATIIINSNTYTIWYTKDKGLYGGPTLIGADLGLVLELDRNNTQKTIATKIDKIKKNTINTPSQWNKTPSLSKAQYDKVLYNSRFQSIELFADTTINFDPNSTDTIPGVYKVANGTVVVKKIKFPKIQPNSNVFLKLTQHSNGDAYDRTGSVFILPTDKEMDVLKALEQGVSNLPTYTDNQGKNYQGMVSTSTYNPAIELMRFFTSFGVKQYNHINFLEKNWQDESLFMQEISEFTPILSEQTHYIGVYIGNYDKGGHKINAQIDIHPSLSTVEQSQVILPLFNTTNIFEMAGQAYPIMFSDEKGLVVEFELEHPLENAQLRYITTGHGGWSGGDEFNPKLNKISLDDSTLISYYPWRQDCGSYRDFNPASGNFTNGLSSSDLSRSNWCPGTVTNPIWIPIGDLTAGKHRITLQIPMGAPQGNSQSYWCTSATLFGQ
ncbi:GLPGLI family protein [Myroides sp. LJL115]